MTGGAGWGRRGTDGRDRCSATPARDSEGASLENRDILMFQCGPGSIVLEDRVHIRFGLVLQVVFQTTSSFDFRSRKKI